jgi:hypothetical protein
MAYELTCPSCQARFHLKDDTGEESLLCPRCLNMVPRPASASLAPNPTGETSAIAALPPRSGRSVPTIAAETGRSMWWAYFVILTLTVLAGLGVILAVKTGNIRDSTLVLLAILCDAVLTVLILFPVGYAMVRGTRPGPGTPRSITVVKRIVVIVLLVILGPIAACIVFGAVCAASVATVGL